tara:strand:- start:780 stop:881 length:102 start_codon:yes stop_codon:yes gene_type:complete
MLVEEAVVPRVLVLMDGTQELVLVEVEAQVERQ